MRRRRNQGDKPPPAVSPAPARKGGGTIKNLLILGAVGVAGYVAWKKIGGIDFGGISTRDRNSTAAMSPGTPSPDLKGPKVVPGSTYATLSQQCISQPEPRFQYIPVTHTDTMGYQSFQSPVKGNFTRRMLCVGGRRWAEVAPTGYRAIN